MKSAKASVLFLALLCVTELCHAANNNFIVFDGTQYQHKPQFSSYGIKPIHIVYEQHLWPEGFAQDRMPDQSALQKIASKVSSQPAPVVLDVESWPIHWQDTAIMTASAVKYQQLASEFSKALPNVQFGYFCLIPVQDFSKNQANPGTRLYQTWQEDNDRVAPIAKIVNTAFPGGYTYSNDWQIWKKTIEQQINETRRIFNNGPIYVFIWPQYFDHAPAAINFRLQFIDEAFWKFQLETIKNLADGAVIWGGWDFTNSKQLEWDENAPWWKATKEFMNELGSTKKPPPPSPFTVK